MDEVSTMNAPAIWTPLMMKLVRQQLKLTQSYMANLFHVDRHIYMYAEQTSKPIPEDWIPILDELITRTVPLNSRKARELRTNAGYAPRHVAKLLGITSSDIRHYEDGSCIPVEIQDKLRAIGTETKWTGRRLRKVRRKAGLTQTEAARLVGVDTSTWSRWETGEFAIDKLRLKENLPDTWIEQMSKQ